jgi:AmiR/NasT family two-component response regulator
MTDTPNRADRSLVGVRVLVAEDEFLIATDVELALRNLGCVVIGLVASCREALTLLERERPDIVLVTCASRTVTPDRSPGH